MKWFKHDSTASMDSKLKRVRMKYGMEGYGLYWYCLELIAQNVEKHNLTFELEHDAELIAHDTGIHAELVQEMMLFMVGLGLFEENVGRITCIKMSTRTDEYVAKLIKQAGGVPTLSRQAPDTLPTNSGLIEEKEEKEETPQAEKNPRRFKPPSMEEVQAYTEEQKMLPIAERFHDYFSSAGWRLSNGNPMKDWQAAARNWNRREVERNPQPTRDWD